MTAETAGERAAILHDDELHQHVPPSALPNDGVRNSGDIGIDLAPPAGPRFADKLHGHEGPVRVPFRHENIFHPHIGIGQSVSSLAKNCSNSSTVQLSVIFDDRSPRTAAASCSPVATSQSSNSSTAAFLTGTNLMDADLRNVSLEGVIGADLSDAYLRDVDLPDDDVTDMNEVETRPKPSDNHYY